MQFSELAIGAAFHYDGQLFIKTDDGSRFDPPNPSGGIAWAGNRYKEWAFTGTEEVHPVIIPQWFTELLDKKYRPGIIDCTVDLYLTIKSESVKQKIINDIKEQIIKWIPDFELMSEKLKDDPIAAPTKNEKEFYKWAKSINFSK